MNELVKSLRRLLSVQRAARIALVVLAAAVVALGTMAVNERKRDTVGELKAKIEAELDDVLVEPPENSPPPEKRKPAELAKQVRDNRNLWGPIVPPPKPPPPKPPKPPDLAKMAEGLSVKGIIGDLNSDTVQFIIDDNGKRAIKSKGNKLRKFTIKGYTQKTLILEYKGRTHRLSLPGAPG